MVKRNDYSALFVTGIAHEYPPYSMSADDFNSTIKRLYPDYSSYPGLRKLLHFSHTTRINARRTIIDYRELTEKDAAPPSIRQVSQVFRTKGVDLAASACHKALKEACITPADITHTVAVTCTDQGNPGYDLLLCKKLGLTKNVQRTLLSGVGCAGGLSALRTAADIAACEAQRGRPARVLVVACELCSLFLRAELKSACQDEALHIAPALFGDAAAAVVVCNSLAVGHTKPIFELQERRSMVVPDTSEYMSYDIEANGMLATITKEVAATAVGAIIPMFESLRNSITKKRDSLKSSFADYDWAIHPGGAAILQGAQKSMQLSDDHIRASLDIYSTYGNTSSSSVLIVLDKLRRMGKGRDQIVATSFGPGIMIEMFFMRRCRESTEQANSTFSIVRLYKKLLGLQSRALKSMERPHLSRVDSAHA